MTVAKQQAQTLVEPVVELTDDRISCQTCEDHIAEFAEAELEGRQIPKALQGIIEHLKNCPECTQELEFVRQALRYNLERF